MTEGTLFPREEETLREARRILDSLADEVEDWPAAYANLVASYERLLGQTRLLISVSDKMQATLSKLNDRLVAEIDRREKAETEREQTVIHLQEAMNQVKTLSGLIPICASCKKVRDDQGFWQQVEVYIRDRTEADFTHSLCPPCAGRLFPDIMARFEDEQ